ncbi:MAG TPA: general secretion pathway protein GspB [Steroidobacteraceae bacterium]|jgi:hypothetical protein
MSFILDALKKSESDRQRQSGPALYEVKVTPPRGGLPPWAIALAALLLVNLGIVAWVLLRHPAAHAAVPEASEARAAPVPAAAPAPAAAAPAAPAAPAPSPAAPAAGPLTASAASPQAAPTVITPPGGSTAPAASPPTAGGAETPNPDDYAPATDAAAALGSHVRRGTESGVPLYQDQAATPGVNLPQLRLDLHVYAVHPADRFVMINMRRLHEGDSLPDGVRVESITPEGAIMSYHGSRFLLPRE